MTIEINLICDAFDCLCSREIGEDTDREIEWLGWGIDYKTGYHYCPTCLKVVEKELADIEDGKVKVIGEGMEEDAYRAARNQTSEKLRLVKKAFISVAKEKSQNKQCSRTTAVISHSNK